MALFIVKEIYNTNNYLRIFKTKCRKKNSDTRIYCHLN